MSFAAHVLTFLVISAALGAALAAHIRCANNEEYYNSRIERLSERLRALEGRDGRR
jgi:hypothetical protein